jgi:hypothetical protein
MRVEESWERAGTRSLHGTPIGAASAGRPRIVQTKRVCAHEGCDTVLSCYNPKALCWQHDPGAQYVLRVHDRRREAHAPEIFPAA